MFAYNVMTEEQCEKERSFPLMEPGVYNFQVLEVEAKQSSKGNPMIQLKLCVWDDNGKEFHIFDYLVATPKMMWKTLHFCKSVGLEQKYLDGQFNENDCPNQSGKVSIIFQQGKQNPNGGYYPDKNGVEDYIFEGEKKNVATITKNDFINDDIPF